LAFDLRQSAVHPAILCRLHTWRAGLHVVLRVEVRARGVGRAGGVDDGEMLLIVERLGRGERRGKPEEAIEIDGGRGPLRGGVRFGGSSVGRGMAMVGRSW